MPSRRSGAKETLIGITLLVGSTLVAILCAELALRAFPSLVDRFDRSYFNNETWFSFDLKIGYVLKRNHQKTFTFQSNLNETRSIDIRTNDEGYRDNPYHQKSGSIRIAAIGDSFTEAPHIDADKAWPAQLESVLGPGHSVYNLGVHNYNLINYYLTAKYKLERINPDVILTGVYVLNDVMKYMDRDAVDKLSDADSPIHLYQAYRQLHAEHLRQKEVATQPKEPLPKSKDIGKCQFPHPANLDESYMEKYYNYYKQTAWLFDANSSEFKAAIESTAQYLNALLAMNGGKSLIFLFPTREQVNDAWWNTAKCLYGYPDSARFALQTALVSTVHSPRLIDLGPSFLEAQTRNTYLEFDGHWSEAGHAVAATAIAAATRSLATTGTGGTP